MLCRLFNLSIETSVFPDYLKCARVLPLSKGNDKINMSNYRPISVLNIYSKIFEKLVHKKLYNYLECKGILNESQYGFRENRGTTKASYIYMRYWIQMT